jgi:hypothetical protein
VLLRAKGERVDVDTSIGGTGVVLERLDSVEVGTLTLGETVLTVKLKLSGDYWVLTPAVHVKGSLGNDERTSIGKTLDSGITGSGGIISTSSTESIRGNYSSTESINVLGESINGISVVERLGTSALEKSFTTLQRSTVVNVGIRLAYPDKLLAWVVEVELDLVGRRTYGLITSELDLLNEILVGVLGHLSTLIGIKEDVINVKRSSNKRLLVSSRYGLSIGSSGIIYSEKALTNGAEVNVDLDLVVLKSNKRKGKSWVAAEPELKRNVKGGLRESVAGGTALVDSAGRARTSYVRATSSGIYHVGKLAGVSNHLVVTSLLLLGKSKLVPDVHPVTVLTVNALTTNLNLNLGNKLLTYEV